MITAEGESTALMIKVTTDLLKQATTGKYVLPQLSMCPVKQLPKVPDFDSLDLLLELMRAREVFSFRQLTHKLKRSAGAAMYDAVNLYESEGVQHLSKAFGERVLAEQIVEAVGGSAGAVEVLSIAAQLYMLDALKTDLSWLMISGLLNQDSACNIVVRWEAAIKQFAPLLGKVVEGFDIPEELVSAPAAGDYVAYNDMALKGEVQPRL
jgi:hypothetical protein